MSNLLCRGWHAARDAGLIEDGAVIRLAMVLPGFTVTAEAIHPSDTNIDSTEYDGVGYSRHVLANVTWAWDAANDRMLLDGDSDTEAFGTNVAAATDTPLGLVAIAQAGGSPDDEADYILGLNDEGSFSNGSGLAYGLTVPAGGLMFSKQAA
jgi:hypothetical protein